MYKVAVSHKFRFPAFWALEAGIYLGIAFNKSELVRKGEFITIQNTKYNITGIKSK